MTYQEFKDFLATFLWKDNDAVLIANLDALILMANSQLNRELDISRRRQTVALPVVAGSATVPADMHNIHAVTQDGTPLSYVSMQQLMLITAAGNTSPVFSTMNRELLLTDIGAVAVVLVYQAKVPDMTNLGVDSWLVGEFLDLYTYAVLRHAGAFLREDERVALWDGLYTSALESAIHTDKHAVDISTAPLEQRQAHIAP